MLHRHLTHDELTPAALDDIIERGLLADGVRLAAIVRADPLGAVANAVRGIYEHRRDDDLAPRQALAFWRNYFYFVRLGSSDAGQGATA